jgi:hypothetical protein
VVVNNAGVLHVGIPLSASPDAARVEAETHPDPSPASLNSYRRAAAAAHAASSKQQSLL